MTVAIYCWEDYQWWAVAAVNATAQYILLGLVTMQMGVGASEVIWSILSYGGYVYSVVAYSWSAWLWSWHEHCVLSGYRQTVQYHWWSWSLWRRTVVVIWKCWWGVFSSVISSYSLLEGFCWSLRSPSTPYYTTEAVSCPLIDRWFFLLSSKLGIHYISLCSGSDVLDSNTRREDHLLCCLCLVAVYHGDTIGFNRLEYPTKTITLGVVFDSGQFVLPLSRWNAWWEAATARGLGRRPVCLRQHGRPLSGYVLHVDVW